MLRIPRLPRLSKNIFIHGLLVIGFLVLVQLLLDIFQNAFFLYMPPIGFALFLLITFGIAPIILGVLNVVVIHRLYGCEDWQIDFWLNGIFLLLCFTTINLLIQTIMGSPFSLSIGILEVLLLSYPFGYLGKFSNRGNDNSNRSNNHKYN